MKRLTIIALLALLPLGLHAQRIHAFVASGMTVSQIEGDELKGFKHFGFTGGVGALASISDNNRWGVSVEAIFSQHGAYSTGDTRYYLYKLDITSNYIEIPVLLHWQDPNGDMLFGAGLSYGRLVRQPQGTVGFSDAFFIPDTTDKDFLSSDFSAVVDARFTIWRGLQLNLRWQHSILPVKRDWTFRKYEGTSRTATATAWNAGPPSPTTATTTASSCASSGSSDKSTQA